MSQLGVEQLSTIEALDDLDYKIDVTSFEVTKWIDNTFLVA